MIRAGLLIRHCLESSTTREAWPDTCTIPCTHMSIYVFVCAAAISVFCMGFTRDSFPCVKVCPRADTVLTEV